MREHNPKSDKPGSLPTGPPSTRPPVEGACGVPVSLPSEALAFLPLLVRWRVPEGSRVVEGQLLAHLSPPPADPGANSAAAAEVITESRRAAREEDQPAAATLAAAAAASTGSAAATASSAAAAAGKRPAEWLLRAPLSGVLRLTKVPSQELLTNPNESCLAVVEAVACQHALVIGRMCVDCLEPLQPRTLQGETVRAGFVSSERDLRIHKQLATRMEKERILSLLNKRKLCLVLDLDNTLLHATSAPPPVDCLGTILLDDFAPKPRPVAAVAAAKEAAADSLRDALTCESHEGEFFGEPTQPLEAAAAKEAEAPVAEAAPAEQQETSPKLSVGSLLCNGRDSTSSSSSEKSSSSKVCFPSSSSSSISSGVYPHYRTDEEARRIVAKLEASIIRCRVAADSSDPWGSPCHRSVIKLRPGSIGFLREMSRFFELFLYTMGTSTHAKTALRLLDPVGLFFASRVFSREDSVEGLKRISRIFPTEQKLAIAVDDLEFMWSDTAKCIKVQGYFFFGDRGAADFRRLDSNSFSQWLGAARPYCSFLPSGKSSAAVYVHLKLSCTATRACGVRTPQFELYVHLSLRSMCIRKLLRTRHRPTQATLHAQIEYTNTLRFLSVFAAVLTRRAAAEGRRSDLDAATTAEAASAAAPATTAPAAAAEWQRHEEAHAQQQREQREELLQQQEQLQQQHDLPAAAAEAAAAAAAAEAAAGRDSSPLERQQQETGAAASDPAQQQQTARLQPSERAWKHPADSFPCPRPFKRHARRASLNSSSSSSSSNDSSSGGTAPADAGAPAPDEESFPTAALAAGEAAAAAGAEQSRGGAGGGRAEGASRPEGAGDRRRVGAPAGLSEGRRVLLQQEGPFSRSFLDFRELRDVDRQLDYLGQILKAIHFLYFRAVGRLIKAHRKSTTHSGRRPRDNSNSRSSSSSAELSDSSSSSATSSSGEEEDTTRTSNKSSSSGSREQRATARLSGGGRGRVGRCRRRDRLEESHSCPVALSVLENLPDVSWVLQALRQQALRGVVLSSTGLQGRHVPQLSASDVGRLVTLLGASVNDAFDSSCTHLICTKVTDKYILARKLGVPRLHITWLEKALYTWRRPVEAAFEFTKCEGVYRSCWEPDEKHDPLRDDIYGPVVRSVNKTIRALQRSSYVHLVEALQGPLKQADLLAAQETPAAAAEAAEAPAAAEGEEERLEQEQGEARAEEVTEEDWEELWADGFKAIEEEEEQQAAESL
ncbi:hypothetical protein Esti_005094 [Eimeria stiedai]